MSSKIIFIALFAALMVTSASAQAIPPIGDYAASPNEYIGDYVNSGAPSFEYTDYQYQYGAAYDYAPVPAPAGGATTTSPKLSPGMAPTAASPSPKASPAMSPTTSPKLSPAMAPKMSPTVATPSPKLSPAAATPIYYIQPPSSSTSSAPIGIIVGAVVGSIALIAAIVGGLLFWRKHENNQQPTLTPSRAAPTTTPDDIEKPPTRPEFSLATNLSSLRDSNDPVLQWIASRPPGQNSAAPRTAAASSAVPDSLKPLQFSWENVRVIKSLGVGSFGKVFLGELHHAPVALKLLIDAKAVEASSVGHQSTGMKPATATQTVTVASQSKLLDEVAVMATLRNTNVAFLTGFCVDPPCLAMEYYPRGSMFDVLNQGATDPVMAAELTWQRRLGMAADAAAGMHHLHTRSILHRDLKSPNLLIALDWTVKVADMGLSKLVGEETRNSTATAGGATNPRWLAPEILRGDRPTAASDVFSFGIIMWEMLTWKLPWLDTSVWGIVGKVLDGERPPLPSLSELPGFSGQAALPTETLNAFIALMNECWAPQPDARPNFGDIAAKLRTLCTQN